MVTPDLIFPPSGEGMRVGARLPKLRLNIADASGPVDLSDGGLTVTFTGYDLNTNVIKTNAQSATGAVGYVEYAWAAADTDTAGDYGGFFSVTDGSGKVQHYPRGKSINYKIIDPGAR